MKSQEGGTLTGIFKFKNRIEWDYIPEFRWASTHTRFLEDICWMPDGTGKTVKVKIYKQKDNPDDYLYVYADKYIFGEPAFEYEVLPDDRDKDPQQ